MTRFARAKGSKASNEKAPEDSTPWEVMKEQLLQAKKDGHEAKKREEAEQQRIENYENFLKEHKVQKRKATWCEFPEAESNKHKVSQQLELPPKKKKNKHKEVNRSTESTPLGNTLVENNATEYSSSKKLKKKKHKQNFEPGPLVNKTETIDTAQEHNDAIVKDTVKSKQKKKSKKNGQPSEDVSQINQSQVKDQKLTAPNKNGQSKKNKNAKIALGGDSISSQENNIVSLNEKTDDSKLNQKKKKDKLVNGVPVRRKPINDHSFQLIINGKEVELVRFDGFPIMKKDAERLQELKSNMMKKGIPKSEVNRTLKLERRRAEKALARLKRDVCYNCRKGGHNLSDCPELKTKIPGVGAAEGVCFKCGSTEHRQFECKVQKDKEFRFATCFICKEPGHIARQCPDNPKGLYPNGGSCKLCGDVTHLRKDCPTVTDKKEETSIKLQTLDSTENLEGIEQGNNITRPPDTIKKPKKIKF